jgi:hypothetical protein
MKSQQSVKQVRVGGGGGCRGCGGGWWWLVVMVVVLVGGWSVNTVRASAGTSADVNVLKQAW